MTTVTFHHIYIGRASDGTKLVTLRWPLPKGLPGIPRDELDALYEVALELAARKDEIRDLVIASIQQTGETRGWLLSTRMTPVRWKQGAEDVLRREFGDAAFKPALKSPDEILDEFGPNARAIVCEFTTGGEPTSFLRRPERTFVRVEG